MVCTNGIFFDSPPCPPPNSLDETMLLYAPYSVHNTTLIEHFCLLYLLLYVTYEQNKIFKLYFFPFFKKKALNFNCHSESIWCNGQGAVIETRRFWVLGILYSRGLQPPNPTTRPWPVGNWSMEVAGSTCVQLHLHEQRANTHTITCHSHGDLPSPPKLERLGNTAL